MKSELLKMARALIADNKEDYVCWAIMEAAYTLGLDGESGSSETGKRADFTALEDDLLSEIHRALRPWSTVTEWLQHEVGVNRRLFNEKRMRDYRLRWLDAMIADYQSKGE